MVSATPKSAPEAGKLSKPGARARRADS